MKNIKFHALPLLKVVCFVMSFLLALVSCSTEDFSTPASEPNLKAAYTISGGSITVPVSVTSALYGYRVYLEPG